jgi:hypothetical protein
MPRKNTQLRAYMYWNGGDCRFIFALTSAKARAIGIESSQEFYDTWNEISGVTAKRRPDLDHLLDRDAKEPYSVRSDLTLREAYFWFGDYRGDPCLKCEKHEIVNTWSECNFPATAICSECGQCAECGCEKGCENA